MAFKAIEKKLLRGRTAPNLADYARTRAEFSWEAAEQRCLSPNSSGFGGLMRAHAADKDPAFSQQIREGLPKPVPIP
jgi:hypothetical protein